MNGGPPGTFPFTAVLGMPEMRLALLLNAVSPTIGGVLVRGEKGTAKSTAVRALAALLPPVSVVPGCRFACDPQRSDPGCPDGPHLAPPGTGNGAGGAAGCGEIRPARLVELPVGAAEDRVVGSLDLERALREGVRAFEPGLLAAAHRGVLYVDEVNLLHDHLVDLLLDAAAMGRCHVEREGVSVSHAARFLLVGTMNPEEGELRPQLLDRFGLTVEVAASRDPEVRVEVVRRSLAAEADPEGFAARWRGEEVALAARIARARATLPSVVLPDGALRQIAEVCAAFDVDGMRADIVTARAAVAHAAWHGRSAVTEADVRAAARLALPHRRRRNPFDEPCLDEDRLDEVLRRSRPPEDDPEPQPPEDGPDGGGPGDGPSGGPDGDGGPGPSGGGAPAPGTGEARSPGGAPGTGDGHQTGDAGPSGESPAGAPGPGERERAPVAALPGFTARLLTAPGVGEGAPGRRSRARTGHGHTTGARRPADRSTGPLHLPATVRAAAPHQLARGRTGGPLVLAPCDVREAVREGREGNLVLFVVDASGSMGARQRMAAVKGAVLALLVDAYQRRDKVGLVAFRGTRAWTALPPTSSVEAAVARLAELPTGGRTPLAEGLLEAHRLLGLERLRDPRRRPLVVLVTDGRATAGPDPAGRALRAARLFSAGRAVSGGAVSGGAVSGRSVSGGVAAVVVDCESGPVRLGLAARLAAELGAEYHPVAEVAAEPLAAVARRDDGRRGPDRRAA